MGSLPVVTNLNVNFLSRLRYTYVFKDGHKSPAPLAYIRMRTCTYYKVPTGYPISTLLF